MNRSSDPHDRPSEDAALRAIAEGVEAETGDRFFTSLVEHLARALHAEYAFVSEITEDGAHFRTVALWGRGALLENMTFPIAGTPCESVLGGEASHYPARLQALFPSDTGLVAWQAESYCGVPLLDRTGTVVGHLAIIDDKPMPDGPRGLTVMRIFAARARAELERAHVETALRDSDARYRDLYEGAPVAYLSFDIEGRLVAWNRRAEELTGYGSEELRGRHFLELGGDSPAGKPRQQELYEQFLAGRETVSEMEGRRKDGSTFWARANVRPLRDAAGNIVATQSIIIDVTDRKRAEEALRASQERLTRVFDSALDAIVTIDAEHRIEIFNAAAEKVFGCPAGDAIGRSFAPFLGAGLRRALDAFARDDTLAPTTWVPAGLTARRADGREFPIEATISRVEVAGRQLYTLILRDIDERTRAEEHLRQLERQNLYLKEELKSVHNFEDIIGRSRALDAVLHQVRLVAGTDSSVLILGETGTGKELIARAVHSASPRKERPLIKVNCAALPTGLIESELFGHEKGAFTGATERRIGRFELADAGTLFLDEIGEIPPEVQVKLLRVLQEREFERIGGRGTIKVDVRLIAATNRNLERAVAEGSFRQDLYYRLHVFPIQLPPLRERPEDIPLLVHYFVARYAAKIGRKITDVPVESMARLVEYSWPGNVREIENVIERAVILSTGPALEIGPDLLARPSSTSAVRPVVAAPLQGGPPRPETSRPPISAVTADEPPAIPLPLEQVERRHIVATLKRTNWRIDGQNGAARLLGMHPSTLRSRMRKLEIRRSDEEIS